MPQTQELLRHIELKPNQYSPLSQLKLAYQIGDAEAVRSLLASGVDPLATGATCDWGYGRPATFTCVDCAQPACLEALLATGNLELLDNGGFFNQPELSLLSRVISNIRDDHYIMEDEHTEVMKCIKILVHAGANIHPCDLLDAAVSLEPELVSMLEDAASLRFSRLTHHKFPRPARIFAAETLRLGYQIASKIGSGALPSVWEEHIMPFLVARTSRPMAYEESLKHRSAVVKIKGATRDTIVKDASLRAAMLDGSLTVRTVREAVVKRCRLSGKTAAELKTKYRDCIKAEFLSVQEAFQDSRVWPDVVEVISVDDVGATRGFESGLVCQALVKTSCGSIYKLRTTKKCYRLLAFPELQRDCCLRLAPWNGQIPWNTEPTRRVTALDEGKRRRSHVPKKRRRRS